jgi:hypothetical protein
MNWAFRAKKGASLSQLCQLSPVRKLSSVAAIAVVLGREGVLTLAELEAFASSSRITSGLAAALPQDLGSERAFHSQNTKQEVSRFDVPLGESLGLFRGEVQLLTVFRQRHFHGSRDAFAWRDGDIRSVQGGCSRSVGAAT